MALTGANLELILKLLQGVQQRSDVVNKLAVLLQTGDIWRAPNGNLSIRLTEPQRMEIEGLVGAYLAEVKAMTATIESLLGPAEPAPL